MKVAGTNKPEGKGYISAGCSADEVEDLHPELRAAIEEALKG